MLGSESHLSILLCVWRIVLDSLEAVMLISMSQCHDVGAILSDRDLDWSDSIAE